MTNKILQEKIPSQWNNYFVHLAFLKCSNGNMFAQPMICALNRIEQHEANGIVAL